MENRLEHNAPVFEVKYELQVPCDVFIPGLDTSSNIGFMALMDEILVSIYSMCDMIKRIAHRDAFDENGQPYSATYESKSYLINAYFLDFMYLFRHVARKQRNRGHA